MTWTPPHRLAGLLAGLLLLLSSLLLSGALLADELPDTPQTAPLEHAAELLKEKDFTQKAVAIDLLITRGDEKASAWLAALLEGDLHTQKTDGTLAVINGKTITNALTGAVISGADKADFSKVTTTNALRKQIRAGIARLNLTSTNRQVRLDAVNATLDSIDPDTAALLKELAEKEPDGIIREAMQLGVAMSVLNNGSMAERLAAIEAVAHSLHPKVRNRLTQLTRNEDPQVAKAAKNALKTLEERIAWYGHAETLFFGLSLGSVLVLAAIGLAITFGVMGVINMAHGELIMLGAYTTYMIQQLLPQFIDYSLFLAIPAAFMVSGLMGILIERSVIRHLYGRPLETLLATFGISLILQQLVRTVISPQNVPVSNPSWMSGTLEINSVLALTLNRLYILLFCLIVFAALFMLLRKTSLGLQVRAVSQNRAMARAMGVRSARVDALTFGLGSGIAGVAGVALSQLTNVGPNLGQSYIIDSFMVVVFGGVGNLWGTLVAGMSLGVLNKVMEPWAGAVLAKILVLVFIILFIQKRPRGLFPQKGRAAGD